MRLIDMFLLNIFLFLKSDFCAEITNDLSTNESMITLSFNNQNEKKENILTKTENQEDLSEFSDYVQNLKKLFEIIYENKEQSRNKKLKIILNVLKIELLNVEKKINRVNVLEFLDNSLESMKKFSAEYENRNEREDEVILNDIIENFILELENIDELVSSLYKFNLNIFKIMVVKYKLKPFKDQVSKLREVFSNYIDFLKENESNFDSNLNELLKNFACKFTELKLKISLNCKMETERVLLLFNDKLRSNISEVYNELIDYYNKKQQLLEKVFSNLINIWKFAKKHFESYDLFL